MYCEEGGREHLPLPDSVGWILASKGSNALLQGRELIESPLPILASMSFESTAVFCLARCFCFDSHRILMQLLPQTDLEFAMWPKLP